MKKALVLFYIVCVHLITLQAQEATSQPLMESEVFHLINKARATQALKALRWASTPAHLARKHSLNMAKGLVPFGHEGVNERFAEIMRKIPSTTNMGENVAFNFRFPNPAQQAVDGWLSSPGHYANIMGDYNLAGVGVAKNVKGEYYFTQMFVKASVALLNSLEIDPEALYSEQLEYVSESPVQWTVE